MSTKPLQSTAVWPLLALALLLMPAAPEVVARTPPVSGHSTQHEILGSFESGWREQWSERVFGDEATTYEVVDEGGMPVLRARSEGTASWFMRRIDVETGDSTRMAWRWKVEQTLQDNRSEREKRGDDYVARVLVAFEPRWPQWRTHTLCYVWSAHEAVGSTFKNPYAGNVVMMVVRSGDAEAGAWVSEERDVMADYRRAFGETPSQISAVCVMVDTDDTGSQATAWFDDITLRVDQ
jgi:hypothetical protein